MVKIRPFRYGNSIIHKSLMLSITELKSDRFGMEMYFLLSMRFKISWPVKIRPFRYGNHPKIQIHQHTTNHYVKIRPFRYGNAGSDLLVDTIEYEVKIRPFRYGNIIAIIYFINLIWLKSDRFGMEMIAIILFLKYNLS